MFWATDVIFEGQTRLLANSNTKSFLSTKGTGAFNAAGLLVNEGDVADQIKVGIPILKAEVASSDLSIQAPSNQVNDLQVKQKEYRWNMFQLCHPTSRRTKQEFEQSGFLFYAVGVGGKYNVPNTLRQMYYDSEVRPLEWKITREQRAGPCVTYVGAILESLLKIENEASTSPGSIVSIVNPNQA